MCTDHVVGERVAEQRRLVVAVRTVLDAVAQLVDEHALAQPLGGALCRRAAQNVAAVLADCNTKMSQCASCREQQHTVRVSL